MILTTKVLCEDGFKKTILEEEFVSTKDERPSFDDYVFEQQETSEMEDQNNYNKGTVFKGSRPEEPPY